MISGDLLGSYSGRTYGSAQGATQAVINELDYYELKAIPAAMKSAMNRYLKLIAGRMVAKHKRPWPTGPMPGGTNPATLSSRTGKATQSIRDSVKVKEAGNEIVGYIGGIFYLKSHEYGAVIRARRSQYLTIPLPAALDSRGVPLKRSAREWADTFVIKSKNNNLLIVQKNASGIVPLYVLKREVRIPKRLGMKDELERYINLFASFVEQDIRREFKVIGL
jgi:hypothetical protein